ncbi:hypothetical protein FRC10_002988 [Ceratobasidium sp. 414]|nr:hypothetical protein FRC10_002988 [Ceratobasidium sp. 414]
MAVWLFAPPTLAALPKYFVLAVMPTMGARLVLNLRSSRREDIMPTGREDPGTGTYEMHTKGGPSKPLPRERFMFASIRAGEAVDDEERHLSAQERIQLNRIKTSRLDTKGIWT